VRISVTLISLGLAACGDSSPAAPDAAHVVDATPDASLDASPDAALDAAPGFGALSGMCGAITPADLTGPTPRVIRVSFDFAREYMDPQDRPLLTTGGQHLAETPNAGGSSGLSEIFAYEELGRCEAAALLKTETEIIYDTVSKKTDMEILLDGHKIGVSVTRAFAFPLGTTYTLDMATQLLTKKLGDIPQSTASVSAGDRWDKQFLSILAYDDDAANTTEQAWMALDPALQGDTIVVLVATNGADTFIYTNQ
jgi:hypothetical protein